MPENHYLIPVQTEGYKKDVEESIVADGIEAAEDFFVDAKERLLDVNNWKRYSALENAVFTLTDSHGNIVKRRARKGDHIRINIPESDYGIQGGFNWVNIEAIEYDDYPDINMETFAMRMRPCMAPSHQPEANYTGYSEQGATSTFVIERRGKRLFSGYHGRNEYEDSETNHSYNMHDTTTITSCAWLGLTDMQRTALVKGFIR